VLVGQGLGVIDQSLGKGAEQAEEIDTLEPQLVVNEGVQLGVAADVQVTLEDHPVKTSQNG
jgi:hypothetical protein